MQFNTFTRLACLLAFVSGAFGQDTWQDQPCKGMADGYFVRDKLDCAGYFFCSNGQAQSAARCPEDYLFSELHQSCDFPTNVDCHVCTDQAGIYLEPHPTNCSQFFMCNNGYSSLGHCSAGYSFDATQNICNPSDRVNCNANRCPAVDSPNKIVYLPSTENCAEYFVCQSGTPIQTFCAAQLYWDPINERCDLMSNVDCDIANPNA
uniref:Chitin-binding type-2 domain-containing protein n=1 Tax=Anopheles epiroticus TaxID=199890 RepID=A0A182PNZ3_9DIPT